MKLIGGDSYFIISPIAHGMPKLGNAYPLAPRPPNGLRYLRWGGDGEAVQLEKC